MILSTLHRVGTLARASLLHKFDPVRSITFSLARCSNDVETKDDIAQDEKSDVETAPKIPPRKQVSVETSIRYMNSDAYKQTYGDEPVWKPYRRNYKGHFEPKKTRQTCIRKNVISTGNPCPICRDEYLVLDYRNVKLLKQFINEQNGDIISYSKTGICQRKHKELLVALLRAKDYGTITFDVPRREYDYSDWKPSDN
ncbi:28S ribosomal protein S18b, mitochondrial [Pseudomyrmex gracilis]|uniref:28S ribosomal protein S18b, mitochondrial n=1 Tax=Pseudomyrmex gracilis TaxID=219809 RepID=UPI0009957655|nr:28S ribosomal protein S18b, mitochondrial [Pseudomyrmex gracilis]